MNDNPRSRLTPVAQPVDATERRGFSPPAEVFDPPRPRAETDDEVDLLQLFGVVWRGKWIVLLCALLAALAGGYYAFEIATPKYSATARLALQARDQPVVDLESVLSGVSTEQASINTELEVIRSRGLIERLVSEMNLVADSEFNATLRETPAFSIKAVKDYIKKLFFGSSLNIAEPTEEEIRIATAQAARRAISVSSQRNTYLFDIRVTTEDPGKSSEMANRLAKIYLDDQIGIKFTATEYAVDWLSERVTDLELELKLKEDAIKDLRAETELVSLEALEALNIRAKEIRDRLSDAQIAEKAASARAGELAQIVASEDISGISAALNDPTLNRLAEAAGSGENAAVQAFTARLDALMAREQTNIERVVSQRNALTESFARIQKQIDEQNADLGKLNQLVREADATRVLYETFLARLKETSVQIGLQRADSRILSAAVPGELVQPRKTIIVALSLILGGLLGTGAVLLRQFMHDGFRTAEELEHVTGHTVLGQIPKIPIRRRKGLVDYLRTKPASAAAEAVRNLRTSVLLSNIDNPPKVIMLTSSIPGEGKTTLAIALSLNLSGLGKKVLLVEGDIRRRTFSQYFKKESPGNLVTVISGDKAIADAVLHDEDVGADILMGDKTSINAADLFSSEKFRQFIESARADYDFVIIDTPPVLVVPDARVIGRHADAIIYAVRWDGPHKSLVVDGLRQFSSVGLHFSGLVLSQIDLRGMKRYGYGGQYGAYSGYGRGYYEA